MVALGSHAKRVKVGVRVGHGISPMVEKFPLSRVNDALEHLRAGKARYRIVLENDIG